MSQSITSGKPPRRGGKILGSTILRSKHTEEEEEKWCKYISEGCPVDHEWGSNWVLRHWQKGKKHDPRNEHSIAILKLIRFAGKQGISKDTIISIVGEKRLGSSQKTRHMLCELDKMGLFM